MEGIHNFNDIVPFPLAVKTSEDWFECVKNYLISQDLWEVTSSSCARPDENGTVEDYARWRRNNAAALHVINISCGVPNLISIRKASEAKVAWDILYHTYNVPPPPPPPPQEELEMGKLYKAIYDNNWSAAKAFIDTHPSALAPELAATTGDTPLHVATKLGLAGIVEELVRLVPSQYLETLDVNGHTPLLIAATHSGVIPIAKCLIDNNRNTLAIPIAGSRNRVPVSEAFGLGLREMGRYLYSVTPLHVFQPPVGPALLHRCLVSGDLDIVLDLLQRCKELLFATDFEKFSTIESIAFCLPNYQNKSQLPLWKQWASHYIKMPSTTTTDHFCVDIQQEGSNNKAHQGQGLLHWLVSCIYNLSGMNEIRQMKQQHAQAAEILNLVCDNLIVLNKDRKHMIERALKRAASKENVEFLLRVTKANPELISSVTLPESKMPFFFRAVANRKAEILNLLRGFRFKHVVATTKETPGLNSLLHVAALLAPPTYLNHISGAALQMQRELQWFKAVESIVDPRYLTFENDDEGLSPLEIFKETHKELRKEGEKWMKETSSSCSVVGALIVTIMFAVAFTVPGGNDQTSGYPIFLKERLFKVFIIADALSLFSSTTSVLTFLGVLTSRYAEEDFLSSLPKKLIIGLSTLFLSIATMLIAFSAAIIIMLQHNSPRLWTLPVILLAGVPITLFVLLQFPLLVEIMSSTYGPGLFKKKVETWP
ncbi:hypothetical protein K1719_043539 [Acacia pycnantha]|nr:hypothetical protein K1719_043539 [Acacia pycnantha]